MNGNSMIVSVENARPERLAELTRGLKRHLTEAGLQVSDQSETPAAGQRGDAVTIGQIVVAFVTSGASIAFFECIKAYLSRESSLSFKITRPDGSVIELTTKNVDDAATKALLERAFAGP